MRADTGVGPSMASGSQTNSGPWALLPAAARYRSRATAVAVPADRWEAPDRTAGRSSVPKWAKIRNMASMKPKSPTRLVTNAFLPARAALGRSNQNEIRR